MDNEGDATRDGIGSASCRRVDTANESQEIGACVGPIMRLGQEYHVYRLDMMMIA